MDGSLLASAGVGVVPAPTPATVPSVSGGGGTVAAGPVAKDGGDAGVVRQAADGGGIAGMVGQAAEGSRDAEMVGTAAEGGGGAELVGQAAEGGGGAEMFGPAAAGGGGEAGVGGAGGVRQAGVRARPFLHVPPAELTFTRMLGPIGIYLCSPNQLGMRVASHIMYCLRGAGHGALLLPEPSGVHLVVSEQPAPPVELSGLHVLLGGMAALGKMSRLCEAYGDPALFASWRASLADNPHAVLRVTTASPTVMPGRGDCFQFYVKSHAGRQLPAEVLMIGMTVSGVLYHAGMALGIRTSLIAVCTSLRDRAPPRQKTTRGGKEIQVDGPLRTVADVLSEAAVLRQMWRCVLRGDLAALPTCCYAEQRDVEVVGAAAVSHGGATVQGDDFLWAASGGPTDALVRLLGTATLTCTQVKVTVAERRGRLSLMVGYNTQVNNEVTLHKYSSVVPLVAIVACAPDGIGHERGRPLCVIFLAIEVLIGRGLAVEEGEDDVAPDMCTLMRLRLGPLACRLVGIVPQSYGKHECTVDVGTDYEPGVTVFLLFTFGAGAGGAGAGADEPGGGGAERH